MRVIFLDIDGVLNSVRSAIAYEEPLISKMDPVAVKLLHHIVVRSKARIVVSSTWRMWDDWRETIWGCLREAGWPSVGSREFPLFDRTPIFNNTIRGNEIKHWLENSGHGVKSYIIIDDDSDMLPEQMPHFIHCDADVGLGAKQWKQIVKIWPEVGERPPQNLSRY